MSAKRKRLTLLASGGGFRVQQRWTCIRLGASGAERRAGLPDHAGDHSHRLQHCRVSPHPTHIHVSNPQLSSLSVSVGEWRWTLTCSQLHSLSHPAISGLTQERSGARRGMMQGGPKRD